MRLNLTPSPTNAKTTPNGVRDSTPPCPLPSKVMLRILRTRQKYDDPKPPTGSHDHLPGPLISTASQNAGRRWGDSKNIRPNPAHLFGRRVCRRELGSSFGWVVETLPRKRTLSRLKKNYRMRTLISLPYGFPRCMLLITNVFFSLSNWSPAAAIAVPVPLPLRPRCNSKSVNG